MVAEMLKFGGADDAGGIARLFVRYFVGLFLTFYSCSILSCDLTSILVDQIGNQTWFTKRSLVFSSENRGPRLSFTEHSVDEQRQLAWMYGESDMKDFSSYTRVMCKVYGAVTSCKTNFVGNVQVLNFDSGTIKAFRFPVFVGGILAGEVYYSKPNDGKDYQCDKPGQDYIKRSIEIFMNTGQKSSVIDYLKSINKIQ